MPAAWFRTTATRRVVGAVLMWLVVAGVLRMAIAWPEQCPEVSPAGLRASAAEAIDWFERNQAPDGRWLYRYDARAGRDLGGYNVVRHAGVTMSLFQATAAGFDGALPVGDRGASYALGNLVRHGDWAAFEPGRGWVSAGATALLVAGLAERRAATGDPDHDVVMAELGRFLVGQTEPSGAVLAQWDPVQRAPVADLYSTYYTGEAYWALTLLHRELPGQGWDEPARRIGHYLATERDRAEDVFPRIFDHWAAYGLSVTAAWPGGGAQPLTAAEAAYARRQAGLGGLQVRYESQRTDEWPNLWLRGRQTVPGGLGTVGEALGGLWLVAGHDERLADLRDVIGARVTCAAGMLSERQIAPDEARALPEPERARGAWLRPSGVTQMDDQQHALSTVVRAIPVAEHRRADPGRAAGEGSRGGLSSGQAPAAALVLVALVAAVNPARAASGVPAYADRRRRAAIAAIAAAATVVVAAGLAWASGPLLDWLSVSRPTARVGAGAALAAAAVHDIVARRPSREPGFSGWGAAIVPLAVPLLLRPHLAVLALSAGADRGVGIVAAGAALATMALVAVAWMSGPSAPGTARERVERWLGRLLGAALAVAAIALTVDGVFDV